MINFEKKTKSIRNFAEFSHGLRRALVNALILVYFISLGFNIIATTTLFAISTLIMTFFEFPTSAIADYDSRKKSMMIAYFLISFSFLGIFLFTNFWILAFFWILQDIGWTFNTGASSAWIIDALKYAKKKNKIIGLISQGYLFEKIGVIVGGLLGLIIVAINFRFVWLAISLVYLGLLLITWKYLEERNFKPEKVPHNYLKKTLIKAKQSFSYILHKKNRNLRTLLFGLFVGTISISAFFISMPLFFTQYLKISPSSLSGIFAIVGGLTIVGTLVSARFTKAHGFKKSLFFVSLAIALSLLTFSFSKSIIFAIFIYAFFQISMTIFDVIADSANQHEFDSKIRASLGSVGSIIWAIANSIGIFLAGLSINFFGITNTIIGSFILSLIESLSYLFYFKDN